MLGLEQRGESREGLVSLAKISIYSEYEVHARNDGHLANHIPTSELGQ